METPFGNSCFSRMFSTRGLIFSRCLFYVDKKTRIRRERFLFNGKEIVMKPFGNVISAAREGAIQGIGCRLKDLFPVWLFAGIA